MTIIRVEKREDYAVLPNAVLNDERLSWEARGLLSYLLSKPNHWRVNSRALVKAGPAGRDKVQRILRELEEHGYLERRRTRGPDGKFFWESVVREAPRAGSSEAPPTEESGAEAPAEPTPETPSEKPATEEQATMAGKSGHGEDAPDSTMAGFSVDGFPVDGKTVDGFSVDGFPVDGKTVDGKPGHIANTDIANTEQVSTEQANTQQAIGTARKTPTRAAGPPPSLPTAAAAHSNKKPRKQSLPEDIRAMLRELGWRGSLREVVAFWQREPERVRALLLYAKRKGWGGGLLRVALRNGEWPPDEVLEEIDPAAKYRKDPYAHLYA